MRYQTRLAIAFSTVLLLWGGRAIAQQVAVDPEECAACHEDQVKAFKMTPHSALDTQGLASKAGVTGSCAACHGDATQHLEEGGGVGSIFAFHDDELASKVNGTCLTCHNDAHPRFAASPHGRAGLKCTDCHEIHPAEGEHWKLTRAENQFSSALDASRTSDLCAQCHGDIFAQFQFNEHHRLQEGTLECTSCHDVHEPQTRMMLGGFKQEQCVSCHADKGGPFVFEHGSVKTEGCVACHDPHGSPNRHQLLFQTVAELCFSCHGEVPSFHSRFTLETQCTNCHSAIHGSNFDPFFLK
jgi:DmsE family decaheme c-type cytochrome